MRPPPPTPPSEPVIYTEAEVKRYITMAKDRLQDAIENTLFICGMAPLDPDNPCYDIFKRDPSMDCDTHVESEYYASKIMPQDIPMCCQCAGTSESPIAKHSHLMEKMAVPVILFSLSARSALRVVAIFLSGGLGKM
jgi:hypothetical protein